MFSYLKGILVSKDPVSAVIDCNGVGYDVNIPLSTYEQLPSLNEKVKIFIHFSFSENDGIRLFGFISPEDRKMYRQLISISKIGPKIGLAILSGLSVDELIRAVQTGDVALISTVPGLGKKTSERLIIELKDKVGNFKFAGSESISAIDGSSRYTEAESALITLGYKQPEVKRIISKLAGEGKLQSSEEIIKSAIRQLYKKRNI